MYVWLRAERPGSGRLAEVGRAEESGAEEQTRRKQVGCISATAAVARATKAETEDARCAMGVEGGEHYCNAYVYSYSSIVWDGTGCRVQIEHEVVEAFVLNAVVQPHCAHEKRKQK